MPSYTIKLEVTLPRYGSEHIEAAASGAARLLHTMLNLYNSENSEKDNSHSFMIRVTSVREN